MGSWTILYSTKKDSMSLRLDIGGQFKWKQFYKYRLCLHQSNLTHYFLIQFLECVYLWCLASAMFDDMATLWWEQLWASIHWQSDLDLFCGTLQQKWRPAGTRGPLRGDKMRNLIMFSIGWMNIGPWYTNPQLWRMTNLELATPDGIYHPVHLSAHEDVTEDGHFEASLEHVWRTSEMISVTRCKLTIWYIAIV